jgi:hypothetical protein
MVGIITLNLRSQETNKGVSHATRVRAPPPGMAWRGRQAWCGQKGRTPVAWYASRRTFLESQSSTSKALAVRDLARGIDN